jgi:hypothetical protein
MPLRIAFVNFWPDFVASADETFLPFVFEQAFGDLEYTDDLASAEVVVSSVFGTRPVPARRGIQYVGENVRPNLGNHKFSLSFDYDSYGGRNFRLPLWWWRLDWPGFGERWRRRARASNKPIHYGDLVPVDALMHPRTVGAMHERKFCTLVASNPEPLRINLLLALRSIGEVTGYGRLFGAPFDGSKFDVLPKFRFCLCPENGVYPGYHTEKLIDAWHGGCLPLYSGDRLVHRDFNPKAFVNYQDYLDTSQFVSVVRRLETTPGAFAEAYGQPLLVQRPSLAELVAFLRNAVSEMRSDWG